MLHRLKAKWWLLTHVTDSLSRRVKVENYLNKASLGQKPLPDEAKCRELAITLGVPTDWQGTKDGGAQSGNKA